MSAARLPVTVPTIQIPARQKGCAVQFGGRRPRSQTGGNTRLRTYFIAAIASVLVIHMADRIVAGVVQCDAAQSCPSF